jgi:diguanylate cyclase (GGDEF)-like protein/PAS domain S-box-containing protein
MGTLIDKSLSPATRLRLRAEEQLEAKTSEVAFSRTEDETRRLVHELEVHQIELEMQNDELRQARDEVDSVLEKFTDLYDFAPVGYFTLDRNAVIIAVNLTGAGLLKIDRAQLIGRHFTQFITDKYRPDFSTFLDRVYTLQGKESCEVALLNKEDVPFFVQFEAMASESNQDCRLAMIDITGRRQAEQALRDIEDRMLRLAETAVDAIIMMDDKGDVTFCNAASELMFGCTAEEIIGRDFHSLFIPERHLGAGKKGFDIFKGNGNGPLVGRRTELTALRKDGSEFSMELSVSALKLHGKWNAIGIMRDVTERKLLETEIQDDREYAENIVETVREPLVVLDSDLKILTANHSFYDTFKVTPEETIGHFIYDLGNRQWDIPRLRVLVEEILPHDTVINGYEVEHDFLGIGRKTILLNARQIFRENIGSRIILLAMEDITERKRLEEEIQDARKYAENIVNTIRRPLVVLDSDMKIRTANNSFYRTFKVTPAETLENSIYDIGNRQWDIPKLRELFEKILHQDTAFNSYEVEHVFLSIGRKIFLLNARQIFQEKIGTHIILLAFEDITARKQLEAEIQDAREYAENIVETVREPLVVLNSELKILTANHSFYETFKVVPEDTIGRFIYDLGNRQWDIPKLRILVEDILPNDTVINGYEVEHDFPGIGRKIFLLNARQIFREKVGSRIILLAMEDITARKQLEAEIQDAREYAENIVETVREPLVVLNSNMKILTANHSFYETFKVVPEDTIGRFIYDVGNRQWDIPQLRILVEEILPLDTVINGYEVDHDFLDIGRKTILLNARQIFREKIGSHIILLAMEDITARKLAEERISEVMRQQQAILNNIPNIAWLKDKEGRYVAVNDPFCKSLGVESHDLVGKCDHDIYAPELADEYEKNFKDVIATGTRTYYEESIVSLDGVVNFVEKIKTPIFNDSGDVIGIIGIAHDITNRKEIEVALRHDSTHDALTGLYNRAFFEEELERFSHSRMFPVSVVMADVNGLKTVNDTMGHEAGDALIRLAARIIVAEFRAEDIVARIGGDEFVVLLPGTDSNVVEEVVRKIKHRPELSDGKLSIAFGIATAEKKEQLQDAIKLSDARMYQDKSVQKGGK